MRVLTIDRSSSGDEVLRAAAGVIRGGGIVAYPTDTLYGLAVDPCNVDAVDRLYAVKGRAFDAPLPLVASDEAQVVARVGDLTASARRLASHFWPGPLTLVIPAHAGLCTRVHGATGRVAVRVPDHPLACALARTAGGPITATSANRSGAPAATSAAGVVAALGDTIDLVVDGGATVGGAPSTIVDVSGATPRLVREGMVPWARVLEFL